MYSGSYTHFVFVIKFLCKENYSTMTAKIQQQIGPYTQSLLFLISFSPLKQTFPIHHDTLSSLSYMQPLDPSKQHLIKGWHLVSMSGNYHTKIIHKTIEQYLLYFPLNIVTRKLYKMPSDVSSVNTFRIFKEKEIKPNFSVMNFK